MDLPPPLEVELHGFHQVQAASVGELSTELRLAPMLSPVPEVELRALAAVHVDVAGAVELDPVAIWGEVHTPVGRVVAGRMPLPLWGLGLVADPGGCLDCVSDVTVDRVGFTTELARHALGVAADLGPDDLTTVTALAGHLPTDLARRRALDADRTVAGYGVWSSVRWRSSDALLIGLVDGWARVETGPWRFELEGVAVAGRFTPVAPGLQLPEITVRQAGGAGQVQWRWLQGELGFASGDAAPGLGGQPVDPPRDTAWTAFTVAENHTIDRIGWRRGLGPLTEAAWLRASAFVPVVEQVQLEPWLTWTLPLAGLDGRAPPEAGLTAWWRAWRGLNVRGDFAATLEGDWLAEGRLAWVF